MTEPFSQLPYRALPKSPRKPHAYARTLARQVEIDTRDFGRLSVHYRELGSGPPLLLIHGLMTSSYSFRYVFEPLAKHYRVIAPDLPGAGDTDKPDLRYSAKAVARFISDFMRGLAIRGCDVVGNSMGGYLCMRLALDEPDAMRRLVNLHSPGVPLLRLRALAAALKLPGSAALLDALIRRDPQKWAFKNVHYYDETLKSEEEAAEYARPLSSAEGRRAFYHYLRDTLAPGEIEAFVRDLSELQRAERPFPVPLCLIYARQDPMVPPVVGERLHALVPGAELIWLDRTSHFCHVDSPERVLTPILSFFGQPLSAG